MPRPRLYDIDDVVRRAMEVFWRKGYVATALSDLYEATGLKPGNLYATFKDKETLFRRAFEAYAEEFRSTLPANVEGKMAIIAWLRTQARLASADPERKGCLIVNTVTEREAHSEATRRLAQQRLAEIRAFFAKNLAIARERGEIGTGPDEDGAHADALTGTVIAIMSLGRGGAAGEVIRNVAEHAVRQLERSVNADATPQASVGPVAAASGGRPGSASGGGEGSAEPR